MGGAILLLGVLGALILVGMLLAWRLIDLRLERFSRRLEALENAQSTLRAAVEDFVGGARGSVRDEEEAQHRTLGRIADSVERIGEALGALERRVQALEAAQRAFLDRLDDRDRARTLELVELRLLALGYRSVRFPSDPEQAPEGRLRFAVEAVKEGLPYRGTVVVEGGRVVEENLASSYEMFP